MNQLLISRILSITIRDLCILNGTMARKILSESSHLTGQTIELSNCASSPTYPDKQSLTIVKTHCCPGCLTHSVIFSTTVDIAKALGSAQARNPDQPI